MASSERMTYLLTVASAMAQFVMHGLILSWFHMANCWRLLVCIVWTV